MSSLVNQLQCNGNNPIQLIGPLIGSDINGNTYRYFPQAPGISINPSSVLQGIYSAASSKIGYLTVPGNGQMNGKRMTVTAGGDFTLGNGGTTSPVVNVSLFPVTYGAPGFNASVPKIVTTSIVTASLSATSDLQGYYSWFFTVDVACTTGHGLPTLLSGNVVADGAVFGGTGTTVTPGFISGLTNINMSNPTPFAFVVGVQATIQDFSFAANLYQFDLSA
jgi:hypothetical protein